jgi:hypothetical protein
MARFVLVHGAFSGAWIWGPLVERRMIAENICADVVELDTDHTPHLSMTGELAEALQRFATHSTASSGRLATS